jgi:hypothetical protein
MKKKTIPTSSHPSLEQSIALVLKRAKNKPMTIEFLIKTLSGKGRYLILILLSLPFCQPIPLPGLSTIFGILIAFFGVSIMVGKHLLLFSAISKRKVSPKIIEKIASKALWLVNKIKPMLHQRLTFVVYQPAFRILNGIVITLLGLFLALPLPIPFTNLIPGFVIFLMALGLLEDDGLLILIAYSLLTTVILLILYLFVFPAVRATAPI